MAEHKENIKALLHVIVKGLDANTPRADSADTHWGHVGDAKHYSDQLREIAESLHLKASGNDEGAARANVEKMVKEHRQAAAGGAGGNPDDIPRDDHGRFAGK